MRGADGERSSMFSYISAERRVPGLDSGSREPDRTHVWVLQALVRRPDGPASTNAKLSAELTSFGLTG